MKVKHVETVSIIGAGFMGAQIGLQCASSGRTVWLVDISKEALKQAQQSQVKELEVRLEKQQITIDEKEAILKRLHFTGDMEEGTQQADLVIEAVAERLDIKREVFAHLDKICPGHTILATNSSSIRISRIEDATRRPDRVLNLHFYPPVWQIPMVELMRGTATTDETMERVEGFARSAGLIPLPVNRESTGFIFNRVWRAIKKECLRIVDDNVASCEDIDRAWMIFTGMPIGPFGMMDNIGLDVVRDIEMVYYGESGNESDKPPEVLLGKIARGELGVKTGKGFYHYPHPVFEEPSWLSGGKE